MYRRRCLLGMVLFLAAASSLRAYDDSRLSREAAEKMDRVLNDLLKKKHEGKPLPAVVVFSQKELNSYLYYKAGTQLPPNLKNIDISLLPGSVVAQADLDLSQPGGSSKVPEMLQRPVSIYLTGKLTTKKGWGYFQPQTFRIAFLPIPVTVLDSIVQYLTEHQSGKAHSLNDWFALPYGIKEVTIQKERLIIVP